MLQHGDVDLPGLAGRDTLGRRAQAGGGEPAGAGDRRHRQQEHDGEWEQQLRAAHGNSFAEGAVSNPGYTAPRFPARFPRDGDAERRWLARRRRAVRDSRGSAAPASASGIVRPMPQSAERGGTSREDGAARTTTAARGDALAAALGRWSTLVGGRIAIVGLA